MAKFCEGCPNMGNCAARIDSLVVVSSVTQGSISQDRSSASFSFERGVPQGPTDLTVHYRDTEDRSSKPIMVHGDSGSDAENNAVDYVNNIGRCKGPTEVKRLFGFVTRRVCSAPQA